MCILRLPHSSACAHCTAMALALAISVPDVELLPEIQTEFRPTNPPETLTEVPQNYCRGSLTQQDQHQAPARCARHGRPHILTRTTESWNPPHRSPEPGSGVKAASSLPRGHCSRAQRSSGTPRLPGGQHSTLVPAQHLPAGEAARREAPWGT